MYARSIKERFGRRPVPTDFWEEFPLFVSGDETVEYPQIPINKQLIWGRAIEHYSTHKAQFGSFDEFLNAAGIE